MELHLFEVNMHTNQGSDKLRVVASDDVEARGLATSKYPRTYRAGCYDEEHAFVVYCEVTRVSGVDIVTPQAMREVFRPTLEALGVPAPAEGKELAQAEQK